MANSYAEWKREMAELDSMIAKIGRQGSGDPKARWHRRI